MSKMYIPVIFISSAFNDNKEYYPQVLLDECLYKVAG